MIRTIPYNQSYDSQILSHNAKVYDEIKNHGDVIPDSITIVLSDGNYAGVGYLLMGATYRQLNVKLDYYHIHMQYSVMDTEDVIYTSEALVSELVEKFCDIADTHPDKRIILRHWVEAGSVNTQEFLYSYGFRAMRIMGVMVCELGDTKKCKLPKGITIKKLTMDEETIEKYMQANADAFTVHDSYEEMKYKLLNDKTAVYAAMKGKRIIASVTTWPISESRAATENIFCIHEYREQGITTALLTFVFEELKKSDYREAGLTVYGDDYPAVLLYQKLGYELYYNLIEMHYETEYEPVMY